MKGVITMVKKNLLKGIVMLGLLTVSAGLSASYIDDAAELIINQELSEKDLVKDFSSKEIDKIKERVKELKLKNLKEQKRAEEEKERNKRLEQLKKKEVGKSSILFDDLEKKVNNRFARLENRVSSLERNKNKAVQSKSTNNKVTTSVSKKISKKEAIDLILRGKLGDGPERIEKLKKLGLSSLEIKEIQKEVTRIVNEDQIKTDLN
jgi:hypothetical protein